MAYNAATIDKVNQNADGTVQIVLTYTGDAGEKPIPDAVVVTAGAPDDFLQRYAISKVTALNATRTFKGKVATGQTVDLTPLPTTPLDAALQDWEDKHQLYIAAKKAVLYEYEPQATLDAAKDAAIKAYKSAYLIYLRNI